MTDPEIESALKEIVEQELRLLGEDPGRQALRKTPARVAKALQFLTSGYRMDLKKLVNDAIFDEPNQEMILVRDIEIYSLCEHHLLPFYGKAHVAYIPDGRIIGLSKIPRIVDAFARRLQVQERLTEQIALALEGALKPKGVGVIIEARHLCMMMRGVEKQNSSAVTSSMLGIFRTDSKTRGEFLELSRGRPGH